MDWICLTQGGVRRPVLMIILMNLWMQEKTGSLLSSRCPVYCNCHANCGACGFDHSYHWDYQVESLSGNYIHFPV